MDPGLNCLLLRRRAYGEADLILDLLSLERGRLTCFARAARRQKRGWVGSLSPGNTLSVLLSPRRRGGLPSVSELDLLVDRSTDLADPAHLARAAYFLDLARRVTAEDLTAPIFFVRLTQYLDQITEPGMSRLMEWSALEQMGVLPNLEFCSECSCQLGTDGAVLNPELGSLCCPDCSRWGLPFPSEVLGDLIGLSRGELPDTEAGHKQLGKVLGQLLRSHLGPLESRRQAANYARL